ncbi:MAG: shikimate dehydrogenase [Pseudomonadota bacterium]
MTKIFGVLGDPVSHSLSPFIHNYWIESAGIDADYKAIRVLRDDFRKTLDELSNRSGVGFNVTLPHKVAAFNASHHLTKSAKAIGAVNTLTLRPNTQWEGHNTDAEGFMDALQRHDIAVTADTKITIIGAGGAARAIVYALALVGVSPTILNRTPENAKQLSLDLTQGKSAYGSIDQVPIFAEGSDIVVNTVSSGHFNQVIDLPPGSGKTFVDISYGGAASNQIDLAKGNGWSAVDGLSMLVAQAARSFCHWTEITPPTDEIEKLCREKLRMSQ